MGDTNTVEAIGQRRLHALDAHAGVQAKSRAAAGAGADAHADDGGRGGWWGLGGHDVASQGAHAHEWAGTYTRKERGDHVYRSPPLH